MQMAECKLLIQISNQPLHEQWSDVLGKRDPRVDAYIAKAPDFASRFSNTFERWFTPRARMLRER
jgi:hypothetical protein